MSEDEVVSPLRDCRWAEEILRANPLEIASRITVSWLGYPIWTTAKEDGRLIASNRHISPYSVDHVQYCRDKSAKITYHPICQTPLRRLSSVRDNSSTDTQQDGGSP